MVESEKQIMHELLAIEMKQPQEAKALQKPLCIEQYRQAKRFINKLKEQDDFNDPYSKHKLIESTDQKKSNAAVAIIENIGNSLTNNLARLNMSADQKEEKR